MFKDLFADCDVLDLPLISMLFFFAVFAVVVMRALSRRRSGHYRAMSELPLDDEPMELTR